MRSNSVWSSATTSGLISGCLARNPRSRAAASASGVAASCAIAEPVPVDTPGTASTATRARIRKVFIVGSAPASGWRSYHVTTFDSNPRPGPSLHRHVDLDHELLLRRRGRIREVFLDEQAG